MNDEQLLTEVEDLIRSSPPPAAFMEAENNEVLDWLGRTGAVLEKWDLYKTSDIQGYISDLQRVPRTAFTDLAKLGATMSGDTSYGPAYRGLRTLLFQAQHDLQMKTVGPLSVAIPTRKPFYYFDEIRKITGMARNDLLFVDPYLDAEFVSRYLPQIKSGVTVRLLTSRRLQSLLPAVEIFVAQSGLQVQVRSVSSGLHDRYVFVDKTRCYQSGASFKDGAKRSLTNLTQITDAFDTVFQHYQSMWSAGRDRTS